MRMYHYSKSKNETTVTVTVNNRNKYAHKPPSPTFSGSCALPAPHQAEAEPWPLSPPFSDYLHCNSYQAVLSLLTNASTSINGERGLEDRDVSFCVPRLLLRDCLAQCVLNMGMHAREGCMETLVCLCLERRPSDGVV